MTPADFLVVCKLSSMTAQHVATHCKQVFSEYGWPETLISDNGLLYTGEAFTNMMQEYGVNHITSSACYLQSYGLAEKYVQIVKNLFHKAKEEGKYMFNCFMIYCNTPCQATYNILCKYYRVDLLDQTCQCELWQGTSLD